jgi:hypothetical protein
MTFDPNAAAMRWYVAYRETLTNKLTVEQPADPAASAFELYKLLAEEIHDLGVRRRFAWLYANDGSVEGMPDY